MWRENGDGELYTYFPPGFPANNKLCSVKPHSECNPEYGNSVGRGSFRFARGAWTTVAERVKLNDPGASNGEVQVWVNGKSVINVSGVVLRAHGVGKIRGVQCQTFFGGKSFSFELRIPPFRSSFSFPPSFVAAAFVRALFNLLGVSLTRSPHTGNTADWASPKDQDAYFADFSVAITESF
jgi:hypothetical protein